MPPPTVTKGITFVRPEVIALLPVWAMIRDAIEGETAIKGEFGIRNAYYRGEMSRLGVESMAERYLPRPNPTDKTDENMQRYKQYVIRAVYYNFSRRTRDGMVGQVFLRPPTEKKPEELDILDKNADGNGMELVQVAKRNVQNALSFGRGGSLTDYPPTDGTMTVQQMADNNIQPTIVPYFPWQITNWATRMVGGLRMLSLVVLKEEVMNEVDDYALENVTRYRALRLDASNEYIIEIHEPKPSSRATTVNGKVTYGVTVSKPKDAKGNPFKEIPFTFIGSEANDVTPDIAPMYDICALNIAHYRNSADYEESSFICGQPTPVITGVTQYWVENVLKGQINLGSRGSISLPEGARADLLQADENQMPMKAMEQKEAQALALGAKLVQASTKMRTATEVMTDTTSESSTLYNVAHNVSAAMEQCLRWAAMFMGVDVSTKKAAADETADDDGVIQYQLNTEFELTRMDANDRLAIIKVWQSGGICFPEMRAVLRVDGTASMDDDAALALIKEEQAQAAILGGATIADPLQAVTPTAPENSPGPTNGGDPTKQPTPTAAAK